MIKTKSIYEPKSPEDGTRVLVTRYWPRGVKKEESDVWIRELGPEPELITAWKENEVTWEEFRVSYLEEYMSEDKRKAFNELRKIIKDSDGNNITLLCTCKTEDVCHRKILKEILKRKKRRSK